MAVWLFTTPAPHAVWLDWSCDPGDDAAPALAQAVRWAFENGYRRVESAMPVTDDQALTAATAVGLRREGICRGGAWVEGKHVDLVRLGRLVDDVDPDVDALPTLASSFHKSLTAAGLMVRDDAGRVLLLETSYKPEWEIPGGLTEPGEDPLATARRECREELGLDLPVGSLLLIDLAPANSRRPDLFGMVFDGGVHPSSLIERLQFDDGEILAAHWCDEDAISTHASPLLARRLLTALAGLRAATLPGSAVILRGGHVVD